MTPDLKQLHTESGSHGATTLRSRHGHGQIQAFSLYEQVGDLLGQANCIQSLGDIALQRSQGAEAKKHFEAALTLYERLQEPYSIGLSHRRLARLSDGSERSRHVEGARSAWEKIARLDLVNKLEEEFGAGDKSPA